MALIFIGNGNDLGVLQSQVSDDTILIGSGADDFVQTGVSVSTTGTATATVGDISHDTIVLGSGNNDYVEIGPATATATGANATATATGGGTISNDTIVLGSGNDDFVAIIPTATATATGVASATATATTVGGTISNDMITFGNGNGDYVEIGPATATAIADAINPGGNSTTTATASANATSNFDFSNYGSNLTVTGFTDEITNNKITFGNGDGDFVAIIGNPTAIAQAGSGLPISSLEAYPPPAATNASASASAETVAAIVVAPEISYNTITFGNGNGDYVAVPEFSASTSSVAESVATNIADQNNYYLVSSSISLSEPSPPLPKRGKRL
jgi:hypothetical protein